MIDSTSFWTLTGTTISSWVVNDSEFLDFDLKESFKSFRGISLNWSWDGDKESNNWSG